MAVEQAGCGDNPDFVDVLNGSITVEFIYSPPFWTVISRF